MRNIVKCCGTKEKHCQTLRNASKPCDMMQNTIQTLQHKEKCCQTLWHEERSKMLQHKGKSLPNAAAQKKNVAKLCSIKEDAVR